MATVESKMMYSSILGGASSLASWWFDCDGVDFTALLTQVDSASTAKLFTSLGEHVRAACESLERDGGDFCSESNENTPPLTPQGKSSIPRLSTIAILKCASTLCTAYLDKVEAVGGKGASANRHPTSSDRAALSVLICLHNSLLVLPRDGSKEWVGTAAGVQRACERAWVASLPGAAACTPLVIMMLLSELQDPAGVSTAALKRLYTLRGALGEVDFDSPDSASLLELLLRCFVNPAVLKSDTGRKYLAHIVCLSDAMALRAHSALRSVFPLPSTQWSEWVGDVYLRAWTLASSTSEASPGIGASSFTLETRCLQDLIFRGMHASLPQVFNSVRNVVSRLVISRNTGGRKDIDALLSRIYAPILWRSLDSPNTAVRRNAATLFRDVFPLGEDASPTSSSSPPIAPVALQVQHLTALVDDQNAAIRELGVGFLAEALSRHWASFPHLARTRLCERLALRCDDAGSPGVRVAALKGLISVLVASPASHSTLLSSGALANASRHLHDKNDRVRGAALCLLSTVDAYKGSFPEGVSVLLGDKWCEELFARLVLEEGGGTPAGKRTAEAVARLLLPTLTPPGSTPKTVAKRIAQSLSLYKSGTLSLCGWATKLPSQLPSSLCAPVGVILFRTAKKVLLDAAESGLLAFVEARIADVKEGQGGGLDGEDASFIRKRRGRPGVLKAKAAVVSGDAPGSPDASPLVYAHSLFQASAIFISTPTSGSSIGSDVAGEESLVATSLTLGDIESVLAVLTPLSDVCGETHPLVHSLMECLIRMIEYSGGDGSDSISRWLWSRLSISSPSLVSPSTLPSICPILFHAIASRDPRGVGGILELSLNSLESSVAAIGEALSTSSPLPSNYFPSAPPLLSESGTCTHIHPVVAACALSHVLTPIMTGKEGVSPEDACATLFSYMEDSEKQSTIISRIMTALVQGMSLLPPLLSSSPLSTGTNESTLHELAASLSQACVASWTSLTAHQITCWGIVGGDRCTEVAEVNVNDIVGWIKSSLLPPLLEAIDASEESDGDRDVTNPPNPLLAAGAGIIALVCELGSEVCTQAGLALGPSLSLFLSLTLSSSRVDALMETKVPSLPTALLKLMFSLVSAACEGLSPGSLPILPATSHPVLLSGAHRALLSISVHHPGLAIGALGACVDRVIKLEGGKSQWGVDASSSALSSLLGALLFPEPAQFPAQWSGGEGAELATAAAAASTRTNWGTAIMAGILCSVAHACAKNPSAITSFSAMCTEAIGVCVSAAKRQKQLDVLVTLRGLVGEVEGLKRAIEAQIGGVDVLASLQVHE